MTGRRTTQAGMLAAVAVAAMAGWLAGQPGRRRIERAAHTDPLTGLANRAGLVHHIARPGLAGGTVMLLDLDAFKLVNDTHGHAAGDKVLAVTAQRLHTLMPHGSVVARLGGDEFVVALPPGTNAAGIARALRERLTAPIEIVGGSAVSVGASIGVAAGAQCLTDALAAADAAMYRAKIGGGGVQVSLARPITPAPVRTAVRRRDQHRHHAHSSEELGILSA